MKNVKLLLYCTKSKKRLFFDKVKEIFTLGKVKSNNDLNGKIIAECNFEVEKIIPINVEEDGYEYGLISRKDLLKESCLSNDDIYEYLQDDNCEIMDKGYAIHIKNLTIFDKPRELNYYFSYDGDYGKLSNWKVVKKAPQNMMYAYELISKWGVGYFEMRIIISIRPEWLCKILNGEKSIEVRKKVLKEMI